MMVQWIYVINEVFGEMWWKYVSDAIDMVTHAFESLD